MSYRVKDQMSPRIYPRWLILVGFIFGVIVTLVVTGFSHPAAAESSAYPQEIGQIVCDATPIAPASDSGTSLSLTLDPLLIQATQMVVDATRTAEAPLRAQCATAQAFNSGLSFPTYDPLVLTATAINMQAAGDDPILMTATAMVIQATLQTP
ncbi:MAG: hypothetical protein ABI700_15205 [Chloroflexota bacterium]